MPTTTRVRHHRTSSLTLCCFSAVFLWMAPEKGRGADAIAAPNVEELIKRGDTCEAQIKTKDALGCYKAAESLEPTNVGLLVRIARQYRHLMADATNPDEKLRLGETALKYGQKAATLAPSDSNAQLSPAISYGKMLPLLSSREQARISPLIKAAAEKAVRLDSNNDLAWHILGRWHRVVSEIGSVKRAIGGLLFGALPEGSIEESTKCLKKAIQLAPGRLIHQVELGRAYADKGETDTARAYLKKGLAMPVREKEDTQAKSDAKATLAKM